MAWALGEVTSAVLVEDLTRTQIVQYAGASGDYNPLHTDEVYATVAAGYPSVFAHGMVTMGLVGQQVCRMVGVERLLRFGGRFTAQVWPGDALTVRATVESVEAGEVTFALVTTNQHGRTVFSGYATARC